MSSLLKQLKARRVALGMKQHDMLLRVGMSRQQYQRLESRGNPRLDTIELLAKGLNSELILIPQEKVEAVRAVLTGKSTRSNGASAISDDPWLGLLEDEQ